MSTMELRRKIKRQVDRLPTPREGERRGRDLDNNISEI